MRAFCVCRVCVFCVCSAGVFQFWEDFGGNLRYFGVRNLDPYRPRGREIFGMVPEFGGDIPLFAYVLRASRVFCVRSPIFGKLLGEFAVFLASEIWIPIDLGGAKFSGSFQNLARIPRFLRA